MKYGICRGYVVDKHGKTAGDDIIIYDQELYPTLRFLDSTNQYAQKEQIPVEAVYAYIEAKYTLNSDSLKKAFKQVRDVKKLCYSRALVPRIHVENDMHIFNNSYSKADGWNPIISNPVYCMILSANCVGTNEKRTEEGTETTAFILNELKETLSPSIHEQKYFCPDSIIAGKSTTAFCGHYMHDNEGNLIDGVHITKFYTGIAPLACYQVNTHENLSFGLAISHLMVALNFIQLGSMPWEMIFNTAKMPNHDAREKFMKIIESNEQTP